MNVLVTSAASPRGRLVCKALHDEGHSVVGTDVESWREPIEGVAFHRVDHRKRGFDELLRHEPIDAIVHLAVHAGFRLAPTERHRLNIDGTQKIVRVAVEHGVRRLVVASHAVVYGALADNPLFLTEQEPPSVGRRFPEMQDVVTADLLAGQAMWEHPELSVAVLRAVHSVGPTSRDVVAVVLRRGWAPMVMGYDPMFQVMHELDHARAFALAVGSDARGVFNVTGPGEVPLSVLIREAGARAVVLPGPFFRLIRGRGGVELPAGAVEFLKHPCLIDGAKFRAATGFEPKVSLVDTLRATRA